MKRYLQHSHAGKKAVFAPAFTLIELLVVIAIISLLVTILMPALNQAKDHARTVVCLTNLKSIGNAMATYSGDWNEAIVPTSTYNSSSVCINTWASALKQSGAINAPKSNNYYDPGNLNSESSPFMCPEATTTWTNGTTTDVGTDYKYSKSLLGWTMFWENSGPQNDTSIADNLYYERSVHAWYSPISSYNWGESTFWSSATMNYIQHGYWTKTHRISEIKNPQRHAMMFDGIAWTWQGDFPKRMSARHYDFLYTNFLTADGHAEMHITSDTPNDIGWTSGKGDTASYPYFDWRLDQ